MTTTTAKAPIHPGCFRPFAIPGTQVVVTVHNLSRPGADIWRVETVTASGLNPAYSRSYTSETVARSEARRLCRDFAAGRTPATLDNPQAPRTWNQVAYELDQENRRRGQWRNPGRIAALETELAGLDYPTAA